MGNFSLSLPRAPPMSGKVKKISKWTQQSLMFFYLLSYIQTKAYSNKGDRKPENMHMLMLQQL